MINRFQGEPGRRRLIDALREQCIVAHSEPLAAALAGVATLHQYEAGKELTQQGSTETDIYCILSGEVAVMVNGREMGRRAPGIHVGEMALIDPAVRRSATLLATEQTVVAAISESDFTRLAETYPALWRRLALVLGNRLRERSKQVVAPNELPEVMIGCSVEKLGIAEGIQIGLEHDRAIVRIWSNDVFKASSTALEDLLAQVARSDFAVLILGEEDKILSRETSSPAPRDNVVFELGLFMGGLGRERTFIVKERGSKTKMPSDLLGLNSIEYNGGNEDSLSPRLAPVCTMIRRVVKHLGPR